MRLAVRLGLAIGAVLFVGAAAAFGQVAIAPPPHPSLDEIVKEYRRLGMPFPPKDAPLVRIRTTYQGQDGDDADSVRYRLGFEQPPAAPGRDPRYTVGYGRFCRDEWFAPSNVQRVEPTADALHLIEPGNSDPGDYLALAVHCRARGWDELAGAAYARAISEYNAFIASLNDEPPPSLMSELRGHAMGFWGRDLFRPGTDRKEYLKRLKQLCAEDPDFRTPLTDYEIRCLELTVAPRKSKPGTVEALIDDLTEYAEDEDNPSNTDGQQVYWKLAELGFDAVPTLIEHLNDDRLSRAHSMGFNNFWPYTYTVGHLCSRLLFDLSARTVGGDYWTLRGDRLRADKAREWFAAAKKVGEEKWLLDHAVPAGNLETIVNQDGRPEAHLFRVIGAKYPDKLPDLYRAVLRKPPSGFGDYVTEIIASKLPREKKVGLLEEGAKHANSEHRLHAIRGLATLDPALFRKYLLVELKGSLKSLKDGKQPTDPDPAGLVGLVIRANDPDCWDTLLLATQLADYETRRYALRELSPNFPPDHPDPIRRDRLRFLTQFLTDTSIALKPEGEADRIAVCDYAGVYLAGMFKLPVGQDIAPYYRVRPRLHSGPLTRLILRVAAGQLAERELARSSK